MKMFRILMTNIKDAFKSVFRNFSLSMASIVCTTITLILVGIALIVSVNINSFTDDLEKDLTIVVFMERDAEEADVTELEYDLNEIENVSSITYQSKENIKEQMRKESDVFDSIMAEWTEETNPLQNQFSIKVDDILHIKKTAEQIGNLPNVNAVKYGETVVDQLISVFSVVEKTTIILVVALVIVTTFLIGNTIKLTIFSRKTEIEIMRLVGTRNIVIKLPFLFEGFILGVIGSIVPIVVAIYGYILVFEQFSGYLFGNIVRMIPPTPFVFYVAIVLVLIGSIVGMFGSYRSVRKYLKI